LLTVSIITSTSLKFKFSLEKLSASFENGFGSPSLPTEGLLTPAIEKIITTESFGNNNLNLEPL